MQMQALQIFCDVVRYRSFSRAAAGHDLSQSAASQIVSQLERRLGVRLVDRATRPLGVTDAGRAYFEGCRELLERFAELEAAVSRDPAGRGGHVRVAAIYSVGLGDMGRYVQRFRELRPEAVVAIEYLHPDRVYEKVQSEAADFGLVSFPRKGRDLEVLPWRDEDMVLACAPGHPLAGKQAVRPARLSGAKFVAFDPDLVIRREVNRFLRDQGVAVDVVVEFDNVETIKKAVEVGAGVALLPEPTLRREVRAGTLAARPLVGARLVRPLAIIHRRHAFLGAAARAFLNLLRSPESPPPEPGLAPG